MMKKLMVCIIALGVLAGCASKETKEQPGAGVEERKPAATETKPPAAPETGPVVKPVAQKPIAANPLKDPSNILSKRSVYFDYDMSIIKDEVQAARYRARTLPDAEPVGENRDPGQHR